VRLLLLLGIFLGATSLASAQTSTQQYVYASVPASPSPSSVSGFSKTSSTGALTLVPGSPFNEQLEGGLMAIDGQGKFLFVLNSTSDDISMFQIDQVSGALSEVPASPFAVSPMFANGPPPVNPISIAAERSGQFLFVGYLFEAGSSSTSSSVASLAIDTSGSSPILRTVAGITLSSGSPIQLLTDSKGLHLYVGLGVGVDGSTMASGPEVYFIDGAGNLSFQGIAANPENIGFDFAIDPRDRFIYAVGGLSPSHILSCIISPVDGSLGSCSGPFLLSSGATGGMLVESSGHFLYILQQDSGSGNFAAVYSIDQTSGVPTQVGSVTGIPLGKGNSVADPMGPYIYAADGGGVHAYLVDQQTGNLTEILGSPFNPGTTACCQSLAISGNPVQAISGPAAIIFPSTAAGFGATVGTNSPTQIFSLVNQGNQLLAINSISITGTGASGFTQTNTCLATLSPNAHCSISIDFNPATAGTFTATLQVADNAPGSPQTLALSGTGITPAPTVTFSPSSLSFPLLPLAATTEGTSSAPQTLTVTNSGTAPLHISSVSLSGPNPSDFSFTNNCAAPVAPTANCTISIVFNPIAPGQRTASLVFSDDAPGSTQTISLSGTAVGAFSAGAAPGSSTSASVSAGQSAQYQLQLTPGSGYSGMVSLACSGAPLGAVCQVPSNVSITNGAAALFSVTVTTSGAAVLPPSVPIRIPPISGLPLLPLVAFALALLICLLGFRAFESTEGKNRLAVCGVFAATILCVILGVAGCGGGSAAVQPPPIITPSGTSTIVITPSAMSLSGQPLQLQPIQLTLTVK
jgi:6-phosphogluconolactonase (cycloisomerase 2 family)